MPEAGSVAAVADGFAPTSSTSREVLRPGCLDSPAWNSESATSPPHDGVGPGAIARLVEERGHESLFFAEHTHIPASRETPVPRRRRAAAQVHATPTTCSSR